MTLEIGGDDRIVVERRWKERGARGKVYVDERALSVDDFSSYFLPKIGIPVIHYPQGNPYSSKTWPELSWRSLYRHIYRRQDIGWGGIAERQPEGDQHACILQFLGVAERIYSDEYGKLIDLRKQRTALVARRENYLATLNEIARDLVGTRGGPELTPDTIQGSLLRIEDEMETLRERKNAASAEALECAGSRGQRVDPGASGGTCRAHDRSG